MKLFYFSLLIVVYVSSITSYDSDEQVNEDVYDYGLRDDYDYYGANFSVNFPDNFKIDEFPELQQEIRNSKEDYQIEDNRLDPIKQTEHKDEAVVPNNQDIINNSEEDVEKETLNNEKKSEQKLDNPKESNLESNREILIFQSNESSNDEELDSSEILINPVEIENLNEDTYEETKQILENTNDEFDDEKLIEVETLNPDKKLQVELLETLENISNAIRNSQENQPREKGSIQNQNNSYKTLDMSPIEKYMNALQNPDQDINDDSSANILSEQKGTENDNFSKIISEQEQTEDEDILAKKISKLEDDDNKTLDVNLHLQNENDFMDIYENINDDDLAKILSEHKETDNDYISKVLSELVEKDDKIIEENDFMDIYKDVNDDNLAKILSEQQEVYNDNFAKILFGQEDNDIVAKILPDLGEKDDNNFAKILFENSDESQINDDAIENIKDIFSQIGDIQNNQEETSYVEILAFDENKDNSEENNKEIDDNSQILIQSSSFQTSDNFDENSNKLNDNSQSISFDTKENIIGMEIQNVYEINLSVNQANIISSKSYVLNTTIQWLFSGEGVGIEFNLTDLNLNTDEVSKDFLIINPGGVADSNGIIFAHELNYEKIYRFLDVDKILVKFVGQPQSEDSGSSFVFSVRLIDPIPEEPIEPLPEPSQLDDNVETLTLVLGSLPLLEFETIREEFRILLADMATIYINANKIEPGLNTTTEVIKIVNATACNINWPNAQNCVQIKFAVPLVYEDDREPRLNYEDLKAMWSTYIYEDPFAYRLRTMGITEFEKPNEVQTFSLWLVFSLAIIVSSAVLALAMWKFSCFEDYTRMNTFRDTDSIDKRRLDLYPTPHQTLPPMYDNDYKWPEKDTSRIDMGGVMNKSYIRDDLFVDSDEEIDHPRDRYTTDV